MRITHWTLGDKRRPGPEESRYRAACGRWVRLSATDIPAAVTCKQCKAYLRRLANET